MKTPYRTKIPRRRVKALTVILSVSLPALVVTSLCAEPHSGDKEPPIALSRSGAVGLIRTPSADVMTQGYFALGIFGQVGATPTPRINDGMAFGVSFGFLPRLELGLALGRPQSSEDLTANVKLQLLTEQRLWPAIAAGVFNIKGGPMAEPGALRTEYIAASKHLLDRRINATIGYRRGGTEGGYGGLEIRVVPHLSGVVEYDSQDVNYGVRADFLHNYGQVSATHLAQGWTWQVGFQLPLSNKDRPPASVSLPETRTAAVAAEAPVLVRDHLVRIGLENVSVGTIGSSPSCLQVSYENRSFVHNEMRALANVLATAAAYAPEGVTCLSAVMKRDNLPVLQVSCPLDQYRQFMAGKIDAPTFGKSVVVGYRSTIPRAPGSTRTGASSYGKADLILHPAFSTEFATDNYIIAVALTLQPELILPIAQGTAVSAIASIPVGGPLAARSNLPFVRSIRANNTPELDQLTIHYTWRPAESFAARVYGGRFPQARDGVYSEAIWAPNSAPRFLARGSFGYVRHSGPGATDATYVGEVRYYIPSLDLTARASVGRYLEGDTGGSVGVYRRFGNTEIAVEVRDTSIGKAGLVSFSVPLGPAHISRRPSVLRVRPPDFLDYSQRSLLERPNLVSIAQETGNELGPTDSLLHTFLDRDRMKPPYVLRSLPDLRQVLPLEER